MSMVLRAAERRGGVGSTASGLLVMDLPNNRFRLSFTLPSRIQFEV
jgi:hypothetical protein